MEPGKKRLEKALIVYTLVSYTLAPYTVFSSSESARLGLKVEDFAIMQNKC